MQPRSWAWGRAKLPSGCACEEPEIYSTERTFEYEVGARCDQREADRVVPGERLPEVEDREDREHGERDHLLQGLGLGRCVDRVSDAVGRHRCHVLPGHAVSTIVEF